MKTMEKAANEVIRLIEQEISINNPEEVNQAFNNYLKAVVQAHPKRRIAYHPSDTELVMDDIRQHGNYNEYGCEKGEDDLPPVPR